MASSKAVSVRHGRLEHALRVEARARQRAREEMLVSEHDRIAARLVAGQIGERELVQARQRVAEWIRNGTCSPSYTKRWSKILSGRPNEVADRLRGINADWRNALFQNTPFGFLLTERVRLKKTL